MKTLNSLKGERSGLKFLEVITITVMITFATDGWLNNFAISNVSAQENPLQDATEDGEELDKLFKELEKTAGVQKKDVKKIQVNLTKLESIDEAQEGLRDFIENIREKTDAKPRAGHVNAQGFATLSIETVKMAQQALQQASATDSEIMQRFWRKEAQLKMEGAANLFSKAEKALNLESLPSEWRENREAKSAQGTLEFESETFELLKEMKRQEDEGLQGLSRGYTGDKSDLQTSEQEIRPQGTEFFKDTEGGSPQMNPGGISFIAAAAASMKLNLDLEAVHYDGTDVVFSGKRGETSHRIDAALFLTAIRLACNREAPYFSLDAENGELWKKEGDAAWDEFAEKWFLTSQKKRQLISDKDIEGFRSKDDFIIGGPQWHSVSVKDLYPELWTAFSEKYKNLKSKVVIYPEWLRRTRFGEILYKADVLLKELSSGVNVLTPNSPLPANKITSYFPADKYNLAEQLLADLEGRRSEIKKRGLGTRLWFDLAEDATPPPHQFVPRLDWDWFNQPEAEQQKEEVSERTDLRFQIAAELRRRMHHVLTDQQESVDGSMQLGYDGNTLDLSEIYPRMYIRAFDLKADKDLSEDRPEDKQLAASVNGHITEYARHYPELHRLIQAFRAYVAASQMVIKNERVCSAVQRLPLLPSEELESALPQYRQSDLFLTVLEAEACYPDESSGELWLYDLSDFNGSIQGGVGLNAKPALRQMLMHPRTTGLTTRVGAALAKPHNTYLWSEDSLTFLEFNLNLDDTSIVAHALNPLPEKVSPRAISVEYKSVLKKALNSLNPDKIRRTFARLFGHRIYGGILTIAILTIVIVIPLGVWKKFAASSKAEGVENETY